MIVKSWSVLVKTQHDHVTEGPLNATLIITCDFDSMSEMNKTLEGWKEKAEILLRELTK